MAEEGIKIPKGPSILLLVLKMGSREQECGGWGVSRSSI